MTADARITYRRRNPFNTRGNYFRRVRTPGNRLVIQYLKKLHLKHRTLPKCADTGVPLRGVLPNRGNYGNRRKSTLQAKRKPVTRKYGGYLCHQAVKERILRAFLVEESRIVRKLRSHKDHRERRSKRRLKLKAKRDEEAKRKEQKRKAKIEREKRAKEEEAKKKKKLKKQSKRDAKAAKKGKSGKKSQAKAQGSSKNQKQQKAAKGQKGSKAGKSQKGKQSPAKKDASPPKGKAKAKGGKAKDGKAKDNKGKQSGQGKAKAKGGKSKAAQPQQAAAGKKKRPNKKK